MRPGWKKTVSVCESCTLAVLLACVLLAILFLSSLFCPLSVLSQLPLQGVAQDVILSRTHCLILSDSLLFLCVAKVSCSLHSSEACSPSCLCCGSASLLYFAFLISGVVVWVFLLSVNLLSSWLSDTPCLPCALPLVPSAAVNSSVVWLVGLSLVCVRLCHFCCDLSPYWTNSFLVWHRLPQCQIEVMLQEMTLSVI